MLAKANAGRLICRDWRGKRYIQLGGYAYKFNGDRYTTTSESTSIYEFKGTRPVEELDAKLLSDEDEAQLKSMSLLPRMNPCI
jgi:hypothetical protein